MEITSSVGLTAGEAPFRAEVDPAAGVITPHGELDLCSSRLLRAAAAEVLAGEASSITVVLDALDFIDATGLGVLVELSNVAVRTGRTVSLVKPSARVEKVIRCAGLEGLLNHEVQHERFTAAGGRED
jgi:anti-sigma B factor antagonist